LKGGKDMAIVIRLGDMGAAPVQIDKGLAKIENEFKRLMALPAKTRRTVKTRKALIRLHMLKGCLEGMKL
jgi:hypothetical protein